VDPTSEIEGVVLAVEEFLQAFERRSWPSFESCFSRYATVSLADEPGEDDVVQWQTIRQGWRQVFSAELSRMGPLDPNRGRPLVEIRGTAASVSFIGVPRHSFEEPALTLRLTGGHWLIRHLNLAKLPLRSVQAAATPAPAKPAPSKPAVHQPGAWFVLLLVAALVSIALLGSMADRRDALQLSAAVLAVFVGAVTILRGEVSTWLRNAASRDLPLSGSGVLGVVVGAAFLIT
jgi:hypothetical protein